MNEQERKKIKERVERLVDKTISNCQTVINGNKRLNEENFMTSDLEKQQNYVDVSMARCRRCGDPAPTLLPSPPLSIICDDCEALMREHDQGVMWFVDLINDISGKGKK